MLYTHIVAHIHIHMRQFVNLAFKGIVRAAVLVKLPGKAND